MMKAPQLLRGKYLDIILPVLRACAVLSPDSESSVPAVPSGLMTISRGLADSWLSVCLCACLYVLVCLSVSVPVSLSEVKGKQDSAQMLYREQPSLLFRKISLL